MNKKQINKILNTTRDFSNLDLSDVNLQYFDFRFTTFENTQLQKSNLHGTVFQESNLSCVNLYEANLSMANLCNVNFTRATLAEANLVNAGIFNTNLEGANLARANFSNAHMYNVNLKDARYSIINLLRCNWGKVSDELTLELMRWDALSCGKEAMKKWVTERDCPFRDSERDFYFEESIALWKPGKPKLNHKELFIALCEERKIKL